VKTLALLFSLLLTIACSTGEDGPGPMTSADASTADARPDAPPPPSHLGEACTPDPANNIGQGSCPNDHICIAIGGARGAFCTKQSEVDPTSNFCDLGFNKPGIGSCQYRFKITDDSYIYICAIICEALPNSPFMCPDCDGTCPSPLQCTDPIAVPGGGIGANACL